MNPRPPENGWTRQEVVRLRDNVDKIHERVHAIDLKITALSAEMSTLHREHKEHVSREEMRVTKIYDNVVDNKVAIAKYAGVGFLGGGIGGPVAMFLLQMLFGGG